MGGRLAADLTGRRYGMLRVLGPSERRPELGQGRWAPCACDCGRRPMMRQKSLLAGATTSCGCKRQALRERAKRRQENTPESFGDVERVVGWLRGRGVARMWEFDKAGMAWIFRDFFKGARLNVLEYAEGRGWRLRRGV